MNSYRNTSRLSEPHTRALVEHATQWVDLTGIDVVVKNRRAGHRLWNGACTYSYANRMPLAIVVRVGERGLIYPFVWSRPARCPLVICVDEDEMLVYIAAHESKHVEQLLERKPLIERECDEHAIWVLNQYRQRKMEEEAA